MKSTNSPRVGPVGAVRGRFPIGQILRWFLRTHGLAVAALLGMTLVLTLNPSLAVAQSSGTALDRARNFLTDAQTVVGLGLVLGSLCGFGMALFQMKEGRGGIGLMAGSVFVFFLGSAAAAGGVMSFFG